MRHAGARLYPKPVHRRTFLIVASAAFVAAFGACNPTGSAATLPEAQHRGELRVGLDASFPPLADVDAHGQIIGYEADVAGAIAGALGMTPVLHNIALDGLHDALLARKIDIVIAGWQYDARVTREIRFTAPYYNAGQVLLVREGTALPSGRSRLLAALAGKTIGVEAGSAAELLARTLRAVRLERFPSPDAAAAQLLDGLLDAVISDALSASEVMRARPGLAVAPDALTQEYLLAALRRSDSTLADRVTAAIEHMRRGGTLRRLASRWGLIWVD
jgi:ABC-type amino acid transport substrate-binding protein